MLLDYVRLLVVIAALLPLAYYLFAIHAARRFFTRLPEPVRADFTPPASILVPVHYPERDVYGIFASLCRQDYPEYEILFGTSDETDPAIPAIHRLAAEHPERHIRLVTGCEPLGASGKVSKLARLAREAKHDVLVICDDDVRVTPEFLRAVIAPLADKKVGAVSCFYLGQPGNFWSELEALSATSDFFPGVLVARELEGVRFALGAAIALPRARLEEIGGFEALADYYADDYELGRRIADCGYRVELARTTVWTIFPARDFRSYFEHQLRAALVVRHARPGGHAGLFFTHGLPWAVAAALLAQSAALATLYLGGYLALRLAMAWLVSTGLGDPLVRRKWWLIPLRDAIAFAVWLASFFRSRIRWRDASYRIAGGRLIPL
jgi:ceramide glucosyltransferase